MGFCDRLEILVAKTVAYPGLVETVIQYHRE